MVLSVTETWPSQEAQIWFYCFVLFANFGRFCPLVYNYPNLHGFEDSMEASLFSPEKCKWIWVPNYNDAAFQGQFVLFRKTFMLTHTPSSEVLLHVSADTRFRLYLNGESISFGPAKSYLSHWYYDTVNITSHLKSGVNVLAARVLRFSNSYDGCVSMIRSALPGLILSCEVEVSTYASGIQGGIFRSNQVVDSCLHYFEMVYELNYHGPTYRARTLAQT